MSPMRTEDLPLSKRKQLVCATKRPTIKQLDDLAREVVRARDKKCIRCGTETGKLEMAHCISRARKGTRWDLNNIHLHCFNCHYNFLHKNPVEAGKYWLKLIGKKEYDLLLYRSRGAQKDLDMAGIKIYLEQKLHEIER